MEIPKKEGIFYMMFFQIALKLMVGLIGIVFITRVLGKKQMSQVTPLDFVYALILGGIIEDGLYESQVTVWHMLMALGLWAVFIFTVEKSAQKFANWRNIIKGKPSVVIEKGKINIKEMKRNMLEAEQVRTLLRMQGIFSISEVEYAVLENSGTLSVLPKTGEQPVEKQDFLRDYKESGLSYLLIEKGRINESTLNDIGKDKQWLIRKMQEQGYSVNQIYYAEWSKQDGFLLQTY